MYKACIFDLDGTLCDSVESLVYCGNHALRDLGLKEAAPEDYKRFVGDGVDVLLQRLLRFGGDEECALFQEMKARYLAYFREGCMYQVGPYPGVSEALEELKRQGAKIAVLSNKANEFSNQVCCALFDEGTFDLVCGIGGEIAAKPSPVGITHILNTFGMDAGEAVLIGDTKTDIATAKNANIRCVGAVWGFRDEAELIGAGADVLAATPSDVIDALQKIGF